MTFKQLEAIHWVVRPGGFAQAAGKLHTTQSAVSKRVQEFESLFETPLSDRSLRTARLTEKGDEMIGLTESGLGVGYLPKKCLVPMIESGTLQALKVRPALPRAAYSAFCKVDQRSSLVSAIAELAREACDFGRIFQTS